MQHRMDLLEYHAIQSLSDSIVLWGIMDGKFLSGAIPLEMSNKIISSVLTSTVRMKDTYNSFILSFEGGFVLLVHMESITLSFEEIKMGKSHFIIHKADIVTVSFDCSDWCKPP